MPEWLSDEWLQEMAASDRGAAAAVPGANGTVSIAVTGGPNGDASTTGATRMGFPVGGAAGAAPDPT